MRTYEIIHEVLYRVRVTEADGTQCLSPPFATEDQAKGWAEEHKAAAATADRWAEGSLTPRNASEVR
jgi:hypothetical protein